MAFDQFPTALDDGQTTAVWQAVGVLMHRHHVGQHEALDLLLEQSLDREATVYSVARAILDELPRSSASVMSDSR
jgi:AmiR/NasT family two-component response regulator